MSDKIHAVMMYGGWVIAGFLAIAILIDHNRTKAIIEGLELESQFYASQADDLEAENRGLKIAVKSIQPLRVGDDPWAHIHPVPIPIDEGAKQ